MAESLGCCPHLGDWEEVAGFWLWTNPTFSCCSYLRNEPSDGRSLSVCLSLSHCNSTLQVNKYLLKIQKLGKKVSSSVRRVSSAKDWLSQMRDVQSSFRFLLGKPLFMGSGVIQTRTARGMGAAAEWRLSV